MNKEYIEREAALEIVKRTSGDYATAFSKIRSLPMSDVVSVVRCRDCKYREDRLYCRRNKAPVIVTNMDFCSYGERK